MPWPVVEGIPEEVIPKFLPPSQCLYLAAAVADVLPLLPGLCNLDGAQDAGDVDDGSSAAAHLTLPCGLSCLLQQGQESLQGMGSQASPSSSSLFPVFGAGVACVLCPHLACLQGPDGVGGVDEAHVLCCLSGQGAATSGAGVVNQEVEASTSHLLLHLPNCCLDAVGVCHICKGTGGFRDRLVATTRARCYKTWQEATPSHGASSWSHQ